MIKNSRFAQEHRRKGVKGLVCEAFAIAVFVIVAEYEGVGVYLIGSQLLLAVLVY